MSDIRVETESEILRGSKTSDSLIITSSMIGAIMATNRKKQICSLKFTGTSSDL